MNTRTYTHIGIVLLAFSLLYGGVAYAEGDTGAQTSHILLETGRPMMRPGSDIRMNQDKNFGSTTPPGKPQEQKPAEMERRGDWNRGTGTSTDKIVPPPLRSQAEMARSIKNPLKPMIERIDATIARLSGLIARVDSRITKLKNDGKVTGDAEKLSTDAKAHIEEAKTSLAAFMSTMTAASSTDITASSTLRFSKDSLMKMKDATKEIEKHLQDAQKSIQDAVKALMKLYPGNIGGEIHASSTPNKQENH